MSMADSAVAIATLGTGSVYLMGMNAAVNTAKEVVDNGGTTQQALKLGLAAGAAEVLFEKVSVEKLLKPRTPQGWRDVVNQYVVQQGLVELSEEACTEIANILAEMSILGADSDYAKAVEGYRDQGASESQAKQKAFLDMLGRVGWSGAGGFISGAGMGGGKAAVDYASQSLSNAGKALIETIQGLGADTQKTASTGEAGKVHHGKILDTIRKHFGEVKDLPAVATLTGDEFQKRADDTRSLRTKVIDFFNALGNKVTRSDIGDIELNDAGARDSTGHGYGRVKAATFAALPAVLRDGKIVEVIDPYEGHDYDSIFIVAPVNLGDTPCYVGALVIRDVNTQRYKLHEVLTTDENGAPLFKSETTEIGSKLRSDAPLDGPTDTAPDAGVSTAPVPNVQNAPSEGPSIDIVPQSTPDVKPEGAGTGTVSTSPEAGLDKTQHRVKTAPTLQDQMLQILLQVNTEAWRKKPSTDGTPQSVLRQFKPLLEKNVNRLKCEALAKLLGRPDAAEDPDLAQFLSRQLADAEEYARLQTLDLSPQQREFLRPKLEAGEAAARWIVTYVQQAQQPGSSEQKQTVESDIGQESELENKVRHVGKGILSLGRPTGFEGLPQNLRHSFNEGLKTASPEIQVALWQWKRKVQYITSAGKRSFYRSEKQMVSIGRNGTPSTVAHELFHWVDEGRCISSQLLEPLMQDYIALKIASGEDIKAYLMERYPEAFEVRGRKRQTVVMRPEYRGIADILNGLSDGAVSYGFGHKPGYWTAVGALEAEAWAQFGRHQYDNLDAVLKMFQELFPNFYENAIIKLKELI